MSTADDSVRPQQIVYITGDNGAGKSTLGRHIANISHLGWQCIDGDEFVDNDPELVDKLVEASKKVIPFMRGSFEDYLNGKNLVDDIKNHDTEVRTAMEPFFRALFEKLKLQTSTHRKTIFVYHIWRDWIVDVFREYYREHNITFVEIQVARDLLLDRYIDRMVQKKGVNLEKEWCSSPNFALLREKYGPEFTGNEHHVKKYVEWRYVFHRDPFWEHGYENTFVVNNDDYEKGAQDLEMILNGLV